MPNEYIHQNSRPKITAKKRKNQNITELLFHQWRYGMIKFICNQVMYRLTPNTAIKSYYYYLFHTIHSNKELWNKQLGARAGPGKKDGNGLRHKTEWVVHKSMPQNFVTSSSRPTD